MYESFFGLRDLPFRLTPDPAYLFMSAKHREAFAHLLYGVNEGSGFVAITGEVGAGKTTLIRAMLAQAEESVVVIYIVNPVLTSTELLQTINGELGIPSASTSRKELIEELAKFLRKTKEAGGRTVVIVDEAQNLDPVVLEQLRLLSNLETETEKLIQIVLAGQPELRQLLERHDLRQLNQRVTVRWHLEELDRGETAEYLAHRMRVAGATGEIFDPQAVELIYRFSDGVPRLINILGHRALLVAFTRSRGKVGPAEVAAASEELGHGSGPVRTQAGGGVGRLALAGGLAAAAALVAFFVYDTGRIDLPWASSDDASPAVAGTATAPVAAVEAAVEAALEEEPLAVVPLDERVVVASTEAAIGADELAGQLADGEVFDAAARSLSRLLELWGESPLEADELSGGTLDLEAVARGRGLRYLSAEMNQAFLRVLDLPAIVELELPADDAVRYLLVEAGGPPQGGFTVDGLFVTRELVEDWWNGRAHVFWRNPLDLPPTLGPGSGGPLVAQLQDLLSDIGVYEDLPTGVYDPGTEAAVRRFQESRRVSSDGVAGPITQILLYNALARHQRPSLMAARANAS